MGEKRRLYSRSFERAAETSPADWAVAKKQSYTRRIDPEKSCKENHLREAHSCWTNRKKKKKIARPDLERTKICFGKFCAPPLKDFMVHSYFKNCSRVSLEQDLSCCNSKRPYTRNVFTANHAMHDRTPIYIVKTWSHDDGISIF